MKHEYYFEVRGSELDSFGHVNNAVYLSYLEEARWKCFYEMGWMDFLKTSKLFPIIVETNIRYIRELKMFDKAVVKTKWKYEGEYIITDHDICMENTNKKIAKARGKMILVSHDRLLHDLPDFIKAELDKEV